jgi:hypothetical protein
MTAQELADTWAARMGWTPFVLLELALEYIQSRGDNEAFEAFLVEEANKDIAAFNEMTSLELK